MLSWRTAARLLLKLRRSRVPDGRNGLSGQPHAAPSLVLCDVPLCRDAAWRQRKELERTLGVTYKTAWRMGQQIRKLMIAANGFEMLKGHIELDETFVGGRQSADERREHGNTKTIVMCLKERGGRIVTEVIPNTSMASLREVTLRTVEKGSVISTEEWSGYNLLKRDGFDHKAVNHKATQWRKYNYRRDDWHHTNNVESFWNLFKTSIRSTHIHVSPKYMDRYLGEFTFRSNWRQMQNAMFDLLIAAV